MAERKENPYVRQYTKEIWDLVLKENKDLAKDFINYCKSVDRSPATVAQYETTLRWLLCYIFRDFDNKSFIKLTKRDIVNMQNHWLNEVNLSPSRIRFIKSTMSSMSDFIENILDEEYPNFRNIINKIEAPKKSFVMHKVIISTEEIENIFKILLDKNMIMHAFYLAVLAYSGVRKSESLLIGLDMFNDIIKEKLWKTPEIRTKGSGKAGKIQNKYFIINKFKPFLELYKEERIKLGIDIPDMLVTKNEGKWEKAKITTLNSWMDSIERIVGHRLHAHALRHYYVTSLLESGLPLDVVKELVGHNDTATTEIYDDRKKEDKFDKYLDKI